MPQELFWPAALPNWNNLLFVKHLLAAWCFSNNIFLRKSQFPLSQNDSLYGSTIILCWYPLSKGRLWRVTFPESLVGKLLMMSDCSYIVLAFPSVWLQQHNVEHCSKFCPKCDIDYSWFFFNRGLLTRKDYLRSIFHELSRVKKVCKSIFHVKISSIFFCQSKLLWRWYCYHLIDNT